ncbi:MAG: DUF2330 domain-containing protein [Planctomycetaceae bacterium]
MLSSRDTRQANLRTTSIPCQIQIVSSSDAGGLKQWLVDNAYHIPDGVEPMLQQYVQEQWYFAAVKVRVKAKTATLKPLQLDFASKRPVYPLRISSAGKGLAISCTFSALARDICHKNSLYRTDRKRKV